METYVTFGDMLQLVFQLGFAIAIIATLKADLRNLSSSLDEHKKNDADRFQEIRDDIRDLRQAE
jgi:hypothetical protein